MLCHDPSPRTSLEAEALCLCLSFCLPYVCLCVSVCLCVCVSVCLCVCLRIRGAHRLSGCLSVCVSVRPEDRALAYVKENGMPRVQILSRVELLVPYTELRDWCLC